MKFWRTLFARPKSLQPVDARPLRCATPHLQSGGIVLLYTGNLVEIWRDSPPISASRAGSADESGGG
jgi:hypothetical protein